MLVITRRPGETIHVGEDVVITITEVHGKKVRVGVQAPRETVIWKGELEDKVAGSPDGGEDTEVPAEDAVLVG